jgi:hypothetical protein
MSAQRWTRRGSSELAPSSLGRRRAPPPKVQTNAASPTGEAPRPRRWDRSPLRVRSKGDVLSFSPRLLMDCSCPARRSVDPGDPVRTEQPRRQPLLACPGLACRHGVFTPSRDWIVDAKASRPAQKVGATSVAAFPQARSRIRQGEDRYLGGLFRGASFGTKLILRGRFLGRAFRPSP